MTQKFLVVPTANTDINDQPVDLTGALLDDATITGLTADTGYTIYALSIIDEFTTLPAAASSATVKALGTAAENFASSLSPTCPVTVADDVILLVVWITAQSTPVSVSVPANFALIQVVTGLGAGGDLHVFEWDGTGTRPNNSSVTVTFGSSQNARTQFVVCEGTAVGVSGIKATASGTTHQSPALTVGAGSIVLHFASLRSDYSVTTSYTGSTPDETTLSPPDDAGRFSGWRNVSAGGLCQVIPEASAGSANRITFSGGFNGCGIVSVEVTA